MSPHVLTTRRGRPRTPRPLPSSPSGYRGPEALDESLSLGQHTLTTRIRHRPTLMSTTTMDLKFLLIKFLLIISWGSACSNERTIIREPERYSRYEAQPAPQERPPAKPYRRSETDYNEGRATVTQPAIFQTPDRSFDGFRVAGPDSDLAPGWWDSLMEKASRDGRGSLFVFDTFRARHKDLEVYQTDGAAAVLREFKKWAEQRGLGQDFQRYWGP